MCDIVSSNFEEEFPKILDAIRSASFIAIDTEFTGLDVNEQDKHSLFDSVSERYAKLRVHASSFVVCQIGLSCFVKEETKNRYHAHSYNFYVCPRSQGVVGDSRFLLQASCIEFLCQNNFDFNKFAYEGVSYLNETQEAALRLQLRNEDPFDGVRIDLDYNVVKECCERVSTWLATDPEQDEQLAVAVDRCVATYVVHRKIRSDFEEILVRKVSLERRAELQLAGDNLQERLIDSLLGFTRVFNALVRFKKPIIGHNMMTDLVLMYNQFYQPLPKKFETFKCEITNLFPKIFDTKHIAFEAHKLPQLKASNLYSSTFLYELYTALDSSSGRYLVLCTPEIYHAPGFERYGNNKLLHEAGYDAFLAGYVFLRTAHIFALYNKSSTDHAGLGFDKLLTTMATFRNKVNLIRANLPYAILDGRDASTNRPKWLVVETRQQSVLSCSEITQKCSQYGSVDVKLMDQRRALVAVSNFRCSKDIVKMFRRDENLRVTEYQAVDHNVRVRFALWCSAGLLGLIGSALLITAVRRLRCD